MDQLFSFRDEEMLFSFKGHILKVLKNHLHWSEHILFETKKKSIGGK